MLVKIEAWILILPGTDFHFPSTSVPLGTFFKALAYIAGKYTTHNEVNITLGFNRKDNLIT